MIALLHKWSSLVLFKIKLNSKFDTRKITNSYTDYYDFRLKKALGTQANICTENKELPKIIKGLFLSSMIKG
jgi:hypothetical protein